MCLLLGHSGYYHRTLGAKICFRCSKMLKNYFYWDLKRELGYKKMNSEKEVKI